MELAEEPTTLRNGQNITDRSESTRRLRPLKRKSSRRLLQAHLNRTQMHSMDIHTRIKELFLERHNQLPVTLDTQDILRMVHSQGHLNKDRNTTAILMNPKYGPSPYINTFYQLPSATFSYS